MREMFEKYPDHHFTLTAEAEQVIKQVADIASALKKPHRAGMTELAPQSVA